MGDNDACAACFRQENYQQRIGQEAGQKVGRWIGSKAASLGGRAANALYSFFGSGDYTVKVNSLIDGGGTGRMQAAAVVSSGRETRIRFREYLGPVTAGTSGAFTATTFEINPGLVQTFPWLSAIANNYEQWTPNGIVFEYKSTSSDYAATTALGSIIMATDYDALDADYASKTEMLLTAYSSEAKPSQDLLHGLECDPRDTPNRIFYVRGGSVPSGGDVTDFDLGKFTVATQGGNAVAGTELGSLYINYDITFRKEQFNFKYPQLLKAYGQMSGNASSPAFSTTYNNMEIAGPVSVATNFRLMPAGKGVAGTHFYVWIFTDFSAPTNGYYSIAVAQDCTQTSGFSHEHTMPPDNSLKEWKGVAYLITVTGPNPLLIIGTAGFAAETINFANWGIAQINAS